MFAADQQATVAIFPCCDDSNDYNTCTADSTRNALHKSSPNHHHCRDCQESEEGTKNRLFYEWVPTTCHLPMWNASEFCSSLGNRTLLLVGDSLMYQAFHTLMGMLSQTPQDISCTKSVYFGRSTHLFYDEMAIEADPTNVYSLPSYVDRLKPDVVVMNTGAHKGDLGDYFTVLERLRNWVGETFTVTNGWPKPSFIWLTFSGGHYGCEAINRTTFNPGEKNYDQDSIRDRWGDVYKWGQIKYINQLVRNYSKAYNIFDGIIDLEPMLNLRPDAHVGNSKTSNDREFIDCLHWCLPGPLNLFPRLLNHMLRANHSSRYMQ